WHKNLALLVYLARSPKRARARDHLIGLLWGDEAEKDARHSLNQAVSTLRAYAGESIETDRTHVRLADGAVSLDVEQLDACGAAGDYEAAARLIAGVFLEGFSISGASGFDDWMASERTHWQRRSVAVLECLSTRALARGDLAGAEDAARRAEQIDEHSDVAVRGRLRPLRLDGAVIAAVRAVEADQSDPWSGVLGIAGAGLLDAPGIAAASPATLAGLRGSAAFAAPARAFSEALRVVADEQPVVIVVDDAH